MSSGWRGKRQQEGDRIVNLSKWLWLASCEEEAGVNPETPVAAGREAPVVANPEDPAGHPT
jgi:hypothetical protein